MAHPNLTAKASDKEGLGANGRATRLFFDARPFTTGGIAPLTTESRFIGLSHTPLRLPGWDLRTS